MKCPFFILACLVIASALLISGCTESGVSDSKPGPSYSVSEDGILSITGLDYTYTVKNKIAEGNVTLSEVYLTDGKKEVYALLAEPKNPRAAIVFAPGAGVSADAHKSRAVSYAEEGITFMVVDVRGNGGKTTGYSFDLQKDFKNYAAGNWPQYYSVVADMIAAKDFLKSQYDVPVYAVGSSNGGRYAVVASGIDSDFSGLFGISTSGFVYTEGENGAEADLFVRSVNPDTYIGKITPSPVVIFHAPVDNIIEFKDGMALFNKASEPKDFIAFSGTHGINSEVDSHISDLVLKTKA